MATPTLKFLSLILFLLYIFGGPAAATVADKSTQENFIKNACFVAHDSANCYKYLFSQADAINQSFHGLARAALAVSLERTESAKAFMLKLANLKGFKPVEYGALKDCIDQVDDSVDRLSQSVREIGHLGSTHGEESSWHGSNVDTWTNAALSQVKRCAEGFSGTALNGKVKTLVQEEITNVETTINIALDLFKLFANKVSTVSSDDN